MRELTKLVKVEWEAQGQYEKAQREVNALRAKTFHNIYQRQLMQQRAGVYTASTAAADARANAENHYNNHPLTTTAWNRWMAAAAAVEAERERLGLPANPAARSVVYGNKPRTTTALDAAIDRAIQRSSTAAARTAPGEAREWLPVDAEESAETAAWFEAQRRAYRNPRSREQRGREWVTRMGLHRFEEPKSAHETTVRVTHDGAATWEWRTSADGAKRVKRDENAHEKKIERRTGRKSRQKWGAEADHSSSDAQYVMWVLEQTLHWDTDWNKIESHPLDPRGLWRLKDGRTVRTG